MEAPYFLIWLKQHLYNMRSPTEFINTSNARIADELRSKLYINNRRPKKGTLMDLSKLKIGRQSFANRLSYIKDLQFNWIGDYGDDCIRTNLKWTFFTYWPNAWHVWHTILINLMTRHIKFCTFVPEGVQQNPYFTVYPQIWLLKSSIIVICDFIIVRWSLRRKYKYKSVLRCLFHVVFDIIIAVFNVIKYSYITFLFTYYNGWDRNLRDQVRLIESQGVRLFA